MASLKNGKFKHWPKGFTLIELLVVISIIALLLSILIPALSSAKERARRVVCGSNQKQFRLGMELYTHDSNGYLPPCFVYSQYTPYLVYDANFERSYNLGILYKKYLSSQKLYYCPSAKSESQKFNTLPNPWWELWSRADIAAGVSAGTMSWYTRSSYYYFTREQPCFWDPDFVAKYGNYINKRVERLGNKAILCDSPYVPSEYPHRGQKGKGGGLNVLYADGSVNFWRDSTNFLYDRAQTQAELYAQDIYDVFELFDKNR